MMISGRLHQSPFQIRLMWGKGKARQGLDFVDFVIGVGVW